MTGTISSPSPLVRALHPVILTECAGLESGSAPILEKVTPVTADLLGWWFQQDCIDARAINFHDGQRQAILHTIYAHEVLGAATLSALYEQLAAEDYLTARRMEEVMRSGHPKYCLKMATGTGKTWVLQALLYWQLLNAARAPDDARFTKNFLIVAPGLIVYQRLLDAFCGKMRSGKPEWETSDLAKNADLFVPDAYREEVFRFVQGNVCPKDELGRKVTAGGLIGICNWHALADAGEEIEAVAEVETPGVAPDPKEVAAAVLPLSPGTSAGNSLEVLNRRFERGSVLHYLRELPGLLVFNDEAHHIHEVRSEGEVTEVEWQKSLRLIAETKGRRFVQVDFSATPYNQVGAGKHAKAVFFSHIIADFDLRAAMRAGLVKSLVLDKRRELGALSNEELQFKADRDEHGNPMLAEGQRVMLRAGLAKLIKLEADFAALDPMRCPKMLVVCEDTSVTPLVEVFLRDLGLSTEEILRVDSNRRGELSEDDWSVLRERLFDMDAHTKPRVVISVLMLREGFDVNNICVIVPLRTTGAKILLEQTVGRGLRLMWRGNEFEDQKRENRERIRNGQEPQSMIDVLSVVEHPAFAEFYEQLRSEGYEFAWGAIKDGSERSTGDLISVGLREGYEDFDFAVPVVLREQDEELVQRSLDVMTLEVFPMPLAMLRKKIGQGDVFRSHDVQTGTQFGDYRVDGGIMTATGYNDFLSRMARRIAESLSAPVTGSSNVFANISEFPYLQVNLPVLAGWVDEFIRQRLFDGDFNPQEDESWRLLKLDPVANHIIREFGRKLPELTTTETTASAEVLPRRLSEVAKLNVREAFSIITPKCIYERLPFPSHSGGFEKAFIEKANLDATVEAFCKVNEQKHLFMRLRYVKESGLPGFYSPDFLVRTSTGIYLTETKAQGMLTQADVVRKQRAAVAWCERVNSLLPQQRGEREWSYCLLGEGVFYQFRDKGAAMEEILQFSRVRAKIEEVGSLFD
jgi:type III restriction enzyme